MTGHGFLKLQDLVLPPPAPAAISVMMICGIAYLGWRVGHWLRSGKPDSLDFAAGFVLVAAVLAATVHALAFAQVATIGLLRSVGWAIAALGIYAALRYRAQVGSTVRREWDALRMAPKYERVGRLVIIGVVVGLAGAALGPVTDADSLDYHIGVPLDWLRHGGAYANTGWIVSRLVGLGECLNMVGLAAGTDCFGAALQFSGFIAAAIALRSMAIDNRARLLAWLFVAACPVMAFLVPNQKPQMLPIAATTIAMVLVVRRLSYLTRVDAAMALGCAAFAAGCKLSFMYSAGMVVLVCLVAARRSGRTVSAVAIGIGAFFAFPALVFWRKYVFFGDPFSPILEKFREQPDPAVAQFATFLRNCVKEHTMGNALRVLLEVLGTVHLGKLSTTLGLGVLAFIPALAPGRSGSRLFLWGALGCTLAGLLFGSLEPRYFTEPYLWAGAALVATRWTRMKEMVLRALVAQGVLTASMAIFAGAVLFPGAWTVKLRQAVMTRHAAGYAQAQWLDQILPADAHIIEEGRSHALTPRPFEVSELAFFDPVQPDVRLAQLVTSSGANLFVGAPAAAMPATGVDQRGEIYRRLARRCGQPLSDVRYFSLATRNPFNTVAGLPVIVYRLQGCALKTEP